MAVVDAGQNLFHEHGGIALRKLTARQNLIEKFATLADFRHEVVALLIFEEFVHLDDVGVILQADKRKSG